MSGVEGSCFCGAIQFALDFPTEFVSHCHCESCRKSHGSAFVTWTGVPSSQFRFLAGRNLLSTYSSSPQVKWGFCSKCGTSFYYTHDGAPEKTYVTVASLRGSLDRQADAHVSFEERVHWLEVNDELPRYRGKGEEKI